jgi:heavy metal sensor kinase
LNTASIRFRLTAWYFISLAVTLAIFAAGARVSVGVSLYRSVDNDLTNRLSGVQRFVNWQVGRGRQMPAIREEFAEHSVMGLGGGTFQVCDSRGAVLYRSASLASFTVEIAAPGELGGSVRYETRHVGGRSLRVASQAIEVNGKPFTIQVIEPLHEFEESLEHFESIIAVLAPLLLIVASFWGYWISHRALTPVDRITREARSISISNLSARLAVPASNDELERLSTALNQMLDRLDKSVQQIRQFTSDASHELRAPLTLIHAITEFSLRRERSREELLEGMQKVKLEERRMTKLVDDLLVLARADSDEDDVRGQSIDLGSVLLETYERTQILAKPKAIHVSENISPEAIEVNGDGQALSRLFLILVDNAVKYTPDRGSVKIELSQDGNWAVAAIQDTGIGIAPEDQPYIFDRFWRADKVRSREIGGTGLGLSIARWVVRQHRGNIDVRSEPGKGSTFTVRIPLCETTPVAFTLNSSGVA